MTDYMLFEVNPKDGALVHLPHGERTRFPSEGEAVSRAQELQAGPGSTLDYVVVEEASGERVRLISAAPAELPAAAPEEKS